MNIFEVLANLYTNPRSDWIVKIEEDQEAEIQPFLIQRWLVMNDTIRVQTRFLDKYVFVLTPKMYLSLAWSIIPKSNKTPFVKYIKQVEDEEEMQFILSEVRKWYKISDNDYRANKDRIISAIKKDTANWFAEFGVPKKYWAKYYIDFNLIKKHNVFEEVKQEQALSKWGF